MAVLLEVVREVLVRLVQMEIKAHLVHSYFQAVEQERAALAVVCHYQPAVPAEPECMPVLLVLKAARAVLQSQQAVRVIEVRMEPAVPVVVPV